MEWQVNYKWILLEMYDRMVRNHIGVEMAEYFSREEISNKDFILERIGLEAQYLMKSAQQNQQKTQEKTIQGDRIQHLINMVYKAFSQPKKIGDAMLKVLFPMGSSLQVRKFRNSGEIYSWMYDRYSLASRLQNCGFDKANRCMAHESSISDWDSYHLDGTTDGNDSILPIYLWRYLSLTKFSNLSLLI